MKVLVTGGAGYIRSVLVDRLITQRHLVNESNILEDANAELLANS